MTCNCSMAGTQACFYCQQRYQPYYPPQPAVKWPEYPPFIQVPEIDYEKLADLVAEKLKKATKEKVTSGE